MNVPGDTMHSPIFPQMIDEITVERPPFELYDLEVDPLERTNLFDRPAYAVVFEELRSHLLAWMQETEGVPSCWPDCVAILLQCFATTCGSAIMTYDILVYGPIFCDLIFTGLPTMPTLGTELFADELTVTIGGSAIVAAGLHKLGARTGLIADLGNDPLSDVVRRLMDDLGVDGL